jgi:RNA polymerase sigma factor (sigma-70 family)
VTAPDEQGEEGEQPRVDWDRLVTAYLGGSEDAGNQLFGQILRENIPNAIRALDRSLTEQEVADVAKRVEAKLFDRGGLATYRGPNSFLAWLRSVCRSERAGYFRERQRSREVFVDSAEDPAATATGAGGSAPSAAADPAMTLVSREMIDRILACIAKLADDERKLVDLHMFEEADAATVAARFGRTMPQTYLDIHRVRKKLAACITTAGVPGVPRKMQPPKDLPGKDVSG